MAGIAGFILAMVTIFKPTVAPWTSPVYAAMEGVFLGAISHIIEMQKFAKGYPGIALQAVMLTVGTLARSCCSSTAAGRSGSPSGSGRASSWRPGAVCLFYLVSMLLRMLRRGHARSASAPTRSSIGFSLFVVGLAAFNLLLDFDFIEEAARRGAPKYMEWYGAFGLIVTLVWLYLEMLRLLQKIASSRD